jgi:hypothetical protein
MAVDLARLSLWLATLAREHEFTFLDHALKAGDSLVGLSQAEMRAAHWDETKPGLPLLQGLIDERVEAALAGRAEIRDAPDDVTRAIQEVRHRTVERRLEHARWIGDAVIAAFFSASKASLRERKRQEVESWLQSADRALWDRLQATAKSLREGEPHERIRPFHWEIEFPEVFARADPGFDAIVGNPPFAGKNTMAAGHRPGYGGWLQSLHAGAHGNADLVAHFFRRAFGLLRRGGAFGLIATNTIGQGDTRATGLAAILARGGTITRATRRLKWPGESAVVVSVVHLVKGQARSPILDGCQVRRISAYLVEGDLDDAPAPLAANVGKAFQGSIVLGLGFTFDDRNLAKGSSPIAEMDRLIARDPRNAERIFPYIGGEEVNTSPTHAHHRYVINFEDFPLRREDLGARWEQADERQQRHWLRNGIVPLDYAAQVAADWPDLLTIVEGRVKPERDRLGDNGDARRRKKFWWLWGRYTPGLYQTIACIPSVLVIGAAASAYHTVAQLSSALIFSHKLIVVASHGSSGLASLQSRCHELWSARLGSTRGVADDLTYNPTQVFRTFPFPDGFESDAALEAAGEAYHAHRAAMMIERNEGLTKTYNRFHDRAERAADIQRLRDLHAEMDRAVLRAYGWEDLAERAEPVFLDEDDEPEFAYQGRLSWPSDFRDEVLARLLELNAARHAEEVRLGLVTPEGRLIHGAEEDDEAEIDESEDAA